MKRPTIADVAAEAGVSISTVNRILGGKGSVKNTTIQKVQSAAEKVGYYGLGVIKYRLNEATPTYRFGFLLQQSHRPVYQQFSKRIVEACHRRNNEIVKPLVDFVDLLTPENIAARLKALGHECDAVAVIAADHPVIGNAIRELKEMGKPVVCYITDQSSPDRAAYVGTDNWKLGRTAGFLMSRMTHRPGRVAVFIGHHRYQCQDAADASFRSYIREHAPNLLIGESRPTHEVPDQAYRMVKDLLANSEDLIGILIVGGGISGVLRALREVPVERRKNIVLVCRDMGPETLKGLGEELVTASLCHPPNATPDLLVETMIDVVNQDTIDSPIQRTIPFDILTPANI
ncbi:LacI family transcriptional regulator [Hahella sp. CCB-MM4]|uniref:LacI family DNA-binding transcriptional regulator n=1 Tax=Hahella sp. (strain CCB-MM4) TaxID=1926491 RepID=UPI000B9B8C18|nr:LacI family DNA-binding transcriptional regulator [Hahella sp. CCB-MM4]OZG70380.1 LacI family transcriptional regulator [Hahella sp. CCB-MM4]